MSNSKATATATDYATQRPTSDVAGKAYVHAQAFKDGQPTGPVTSGLSEPKHANMLITALSNVLEDSPAGWADRIYITVE